MHVDVGRDRNHFADRVGLERCIAQHVVGGGIDNRRALIAHHRRVETEFTRIGDCSLIHPPGDNAALHAGLEHASNRRAHARPYHEIPPDQRPVEVEGYEFHPPLRIREVCA